MLNKFSLSVSHYSPSFIIWTHLSPTGEHTCFAGTATVLSIEADTGTPPAADWKRPPGRPRRNWLQQVEEDIGLSAGAAWIAGQDRSMWRTLRPSAGQAQQWVSEWVSESVSHICVLLCHFIYTPNILANDSFLLWLLLSTKSAYILSYSTSYDRTLIESHTYTMQTLLPYRSAAW